MNFYYDPILGLQYTYLGHHTKFGIGVSFKDEILEYFISSAENCTIAEARYIIKNAIIDYDIKESGDYDRGNFTRELKTINIKY